MNKKEILNRLEQLIDDSLQLEHETYDRDVLDSIWKLFNPNQLKTQNLEGVLKVNGKQFKGKI